ncbi:MAG: hypothetical protein IPH35_12675 [Rhodoferax sp.]|nr:hypothetical protein [Rhodoferax sp.]
MRVAIRADASQEIGTGHVMRCLTLADALKHRGAQAQVRFISCHLPEYLRNMLEAKGHEFTLLDSPHNGVTMNELIFGSRTREDERGGDIDILVETERPRWRVQDIDTPEDWFRTELVYNALLSKEGSP